MMGLIEAARGPVLAACGVALASYGLGRALRRPLPAPALGVLAGWVALAWPGFSARPPWGAVFYPRQLTDFLLLPALLVCAYPLWVRRVRWAPFVLGAAVSWWVAHMPAVQGEFWRVWALGGLALWLMARDAQWALAAPVALTSGLWVAGAPAVWTVATLVLAVSGAPLVLTGIGAVAVALGAGRLVQGGLDPVDAACGAAVLAPAVARVLAGRTRRWGRAGPWAAAALAVLLACGVTWTVGRLLRS